MIFIKEFHQKLITSVAISKCSNHTHNLSDWPRGLAKPSMPTKQSQKHTTLRNFSEKILRNNLVRFQTYAIITYQYNNRNKYTEGYPREVKLPTVPRIVRMIEYVAGPCYSLIFFAYVPVGFMS